MNGAPPLSPTIPVQHHKASRCRYAPQAVRNKDDLECLACPPKYRDLKSFWRYYTGAARAPFPTIFGEAWAPILGFCTPNP